MHCNNCGKELEGDYVYCSDGCRNIDVMRVIDRQKGLFKRDIEEALNKLETINYMPYSYTDLTAMVRDVINILKYR